MSSTDPYDLVPYEGGSDYRTRPEHAALTSWLHGGPRPAVVGARHLDLGCGTASNLLPLAFYEPAGAYVGIDTSGVQIELAQSAADELELANVRLMHADACAIGREELGGPFDYIILHAVYSWVEPEIRRRLLALARTLLSDDGLLLVSYNTYPGWKIREAVRDALRMGTASVTGVEERIQRAQELAAILRQHCPQRPHPYYRLLERELERVISGEPFYILHEYLAPVNDAFYFRDFVATCEEAGLTYLADTQFNKPAGHTPPELGQALSAKGYDPIGVEQGIDFLLYRQFRVSILCGADANRLAPPSFADLEQLTVTTNLCPDSPAPRLTGGKAETFRTPDGIELEFEDGPMVAALSCLARAAPRGLPVQQVIAEAEARLRAAGAGGLLAAGVEEWQERFVGLHLRGMAELRLHEPEWPAGDKPHALARCEARRRPHLTTPFHTAYYPDATTRSLLAGATSGDIAPEALAELKRWGLVTPS